MSETSNIFNISTRDTEQNILLSSPTNPSNSVTIAFGTDTYDLYVWNGDLWDKYLNDDIVESLGLIHRYSNDNRGENYGEFDYPSQQTINPSAEKGDRNYYPNDNRGYYPNSNRPDISTIDPPNKKQPPNSNI